MKPIFINSSPNTESDDVRIASKELLNLSRKDDKGAISNFEKQVENYFGNKIKAIAFDSARTSFYNILKVWNIGKGDEVIVPAFTCNVIVNPVLWVDAKPVYVDVDKDTLNMNIDELGKKITPNTKVILAQHTFGTPMDMKKVMKLAKENDIKVVEDCAHSLGVNFENKLTGTFGHAAVITFGISKVISGVRGGMALIKNEDHYKNLVKIKTDLPNFPGWFNFRNILNPIIWDMVTPIYYLGFGKFTLGKFIVFILQKLKIISVDNIVEKCELDGTKPDWLPSKMSGNLAKMASHQLDKIGKLNNHRRKIAKIYSEELDIVFDKNSNYLRFPVYVQDKKKVFNYFRQKKIILGNWYKSILNIPKSNYSSLLYKEGQCPNAEYAAEHLINLPTFIKVSEMDAQFIAKEIKQFLIK